MSDEAALQKEAEEAFRSRVGTRFASADERTAVVTLCARSSAACGLRPAALVRRWEAHTLNARLPGPVTLKAFGAFVQALRHQAASTSGSAGASRASSTASFSSSSSSSFLSGNKSPLVVGVEDEGDERKTRSRAQFRFGEAPHLVELLLGDPEEEARREEAEKAASGQDEAVELVLETAVPEYRYMDESPCAAARARDADCEAAIAELQRAPAVRAAVAAAGGMAGARLTAPVQEPTVVFGTVVADETGTGRLTLDRCFLRAPLADGSETVRLHLSECPEYSLYPGMVVAAVGTNPTGECFITRAIYSVCCHGCFWMLFLLLLLMMLPSVHVFLCMCV